MARRLRLPPRPWAPRGRLRRRGLASAALTPSSRATSLPTTHRISVELDDALLAAPAAHAQDWAAEQAAVRRISAWLRAGLPGGSAERALGVLLASDDTVAELNR